MNKKQIAGILAAAFVFVFVCGANILVKNAGQAQKKAELAKSVLSSIGTQIDLPSSPFVGVVKVDGTIMKTTSSALLPAEGYNHEKTLDLIDQLQKSGENRGILLYVNTPGGSVY